MEDELPKKRKGRTRVADVDRAVVWKLATIGCTLKEIAFICDIGEETVRNNFGELIEQGQAVCKRALRRKQIDRALEGSDRMLIWLGKQLLGQKDVVGDTIEDMPLVWKDD